MRRIFGALERVVQWSSNGAFLWSIGGASIVTALVGALGTYWQIAPLPFIVLFCFGTFLLGIAVIGSIARRFVGIDESGIRDRISRPEWDTANQVQHYEGVRRLAYEAQSEFRQTTSQPDVTVRDQNKLRAVVDSLDYQVGNYSELWAGGSYYRQMSQRSHVPRRNERYDGPSWGRELWDRIDFAIAWLRQHDPMDWQDDSTFPEY